tara:strand:- start:236 stop:577 length:342 start_codon:yes stop_codon:yes gene_type:complete
MTFNLLDYADSITESLDNILEPLHQNKTIFTFVTLFLVLYGSLAKPKLPTVIRQLFDNAIFRTMILSLILLRKGNDLHLSLMIAVAYIFTLQINNLQKTKEKFESKINYFYKN